MNEGIAKRYITIVIVIILIGSVFYFAKGYFNPPQGDYETRRGDILLSDKKYEEAIIAFKEALVVEPTHRGAMMGLAVSYLQSGQVEQAEKELLELIQFLSSNLDVDDKTGIATLAASYANLGTLYDRQNKFQLAIDNYVMALKVDRDAVSGPGFVDRLIHDPQPSTVEKRAKYLIWQLSLPPEQRVLRIAELDDKQRMYKP